MNSHLSKISGQDSLRSSIKERYGSLSFESVRVTYQWFLPSATFATLSSLGRLRVPDLAVTVKYERPTMAKYVGFSSKAQRNGIPVSKKALFNFSVAPVLLSKGFEAFDKGNPTP